MSRQRDATTDTRSYRPSPAKPPTQVRAQDRLNAIASRARRSSYGNAKDARQDVPDVYVDLLSEADVESSHEPAVHRPIKRRRVDRSSADIQSSPRTTASDTSPTIHRQTIVVSSDEDSEEWESVALDARAISIASDTSDHADVDIVGVSVQVASDTTPSKSHTVRRKAITSAERALRLATHKAHLLFLLFHVHIRNAWCNLEPVISNLRRIMTVKIINLLNPKTDIPQLRQSQAFHEGLRLAVDVWLTRFRIVEEGMSKAHWLDDPEVLTNRLERLQEGSEPLDKASFVAASSKLKGSQDLSNQLFCALLRAVGVEARLVCSLQPLPFSAAGTAKSTTPKNTTQRVYADEYAALHNDTSTDDASNKGSSSDVAVISGPAGSASKRRRIGKPSLSMPIGSYQHSPSKASKKPVRLLVYPIYWIEAFNPAYQKWTAVDAAATNTVARSVKIEPPANYEDNQLSYVVAFEEDGTARDVTQRYARAYNAKTRKLRIDSLEGNDNWWRQALKPFTRRERPDRVQVEDAELAAIAAREGMPGNIQDFKDHPTYALERHLKRTEVIWPQRPVGKVNAGKAGLEPVYRRRDVRIVRSAEKWYRLGREVKAGEQALKHVPARAKRSFAGDLDTDEDEATSVALYSFQQTQLYTPPPVVRGRIPKNVYGNLDLYVPSMVPEGGTHIRHTFASKAARLLAVDYADAVTGFQFKGRQGTAITNGAVVASEVAEAVYAVIDGLEYQVQQAEDHARSREMLKLWKRFVLGLRIAKRIGLHVDAPDVAGMQDEVKQQLNEAEDDEERIVSQAGGFFHESGTDHAAVPVAVPIAISGRDSHRNVNERDRSSSPHMSSTKRSGAQSETLASNTLSRLGSTKRKMVQDDDETIYEPEQRPHDGVVAVPADPSILADNNSADSNRFKASEPTLPNAHEAGHISDDSDADEQEMAGGFCLELDDGTSGKGNKEIISTQEDGQGHDATDEDDSDVDGSGKDSSAAETTSLPSHDPDEDQGDDGDDWLENVIED